MNDSTYRLANAGMRVMLKAGIGSKLITTFARAWLRQSRFVTLLRAVRFDGVIDGGANVGEFANLVRDVLPNADLVTIEPHPGNAELLRRMGHRVIEAAIWNQRGSLELSQPTGPTTSCSVVVRSATRPSWKVAAMRLEDVPISGRRLLLKLDLQGAEPQALAGMGALWDRCAAVILEVSFGAGGSYEGLARTMREHGFEEYATLNELEVGGVVSEADKVWIARSLVTSRCAATGSASP